jgi:hypothetical protein
MRTLDDGRLHKRKAGHILTLLFKATVSDTFRERASITFSLNTGSLGKEANARVTG